MALKLLLLLCLPSFIIAQQTIDIGKTDVSPIKDGLFQIVAGTPFSNYKYVRVVSGSAYFNDDWMKGIATLLNGSTSKCDRVKLDLLSGEILYQDSTGSDLIATTPIARLVLTDPASGKEYIFINTSVLSHAGKKTNDGWYMQLEPGTATLYKKIKKSVYESRAYNSATTEQTINTTPLYFIEISNEMFAVKKPKDIPAVLEDKKNELSDYIAGKKLTGKTDADYAEVVAKYNFLSVNK